MHHSSNFVSFNHTKHHFTRKLAVFDTNGGLNPVRVIRVLITDLANIKSLAEIHILQFVKQTYLIIKTKNLYFKSKRFCLLGIW